MVGWAGWEVGSVVQGWGVALCLWKLGVRPDQCSESAHMTVRMASSVWATFGLYF